jgi:hypothetical protein
MGPWSAIELWWAPWGDRGRHNRTVGPGRNRSYGGRHRGRVEAVIGPVGGRVEAQ